MTEENYQRILKKVSKSSGLDEEELERRVEAKRAKLAGLISKEGAAQVIAAELGINFDNETLKIDELLSGMKKVNIVGKIVSLFPIRTFKNKKGEESKVANFILGDETSNIKIVLWDVNHIELIEKNQIGEGSVVEINNGSVRANEIHLGSFSEIKPSNQVIENVVEERVLKQKPILDMRVGDNAKTRAFIVQAFEPKFFNVCPECGKKANQEGESYVCAEHGNVSPQKKALINIVLDDGTETVRAVLFQENIEKLGINPDSSQNPEEITKQKQSVLGNEKVVINGGHFIPNSDDYEDIGKNPIKTWTKACQLTKSLKEKGIDVKISLMLNDIDLTNESRKIIFENHMEIPKKYKKIMKKENLSKEDILHCNWNKEIVYTEKKLSNRMEHLIKRKKIGKEYEIANNYCVSALSMYYLDLIEQGIEVHIFILPKCGWNNIKISLDIFKKLKNLKLQNILYLETSNCFI